MDEKQYRWLLGEIEAWVAGGIVTQAQAERIRACYVLPERRPRVRLADLASWVGAILIGLGIILLLAYNWDALSRTARLGVAVGFLVVAQVGAYVCVIREKAGRYKEAWGVFQALMVGAALALMGQTYHISDRFDRLLLAWMALVLPMAYLMDVVLPAVVYAAVGCFWGFAVNDSALLWLGWPLLAGLLPLLRRWTGVVRRRALLWSGALYLLSYQLAWLGMFRESPEKWLAWVLLAILFALREQLCRPVDRALLGWFAVADAFLVFATTCMEGFALGLQLLAIFAVAMAAGGRWLEEEGRGALWRPLSSAGVALSFLFCFILSFRGSWSEWLGSDWREFDFVATAAGCFCFLALALWRSQKKRCLTATEWMHVWMAPLVLALVLLDVRLGMAAVAINVYLFAWGVLLVKRGAVARYGVWLNGGFGVLSLLVLARFFDTDMSYLTRGLIFVALGVSFIGANAWLARRKEARRDEA